MKSAERKLLEKAKRGDMDAFAELFEPLRPIITAVAYRIVGANEAEDVTMETFLRAWQAIPRFRATSSLRTWTCRIARNCCLDMLRKSKHRGNLVTASENGPDWDSVADQKADHPSSHIIKSETAEAVRGALAQLPEEHRQVMLLKYSDNLSYAEIAAATGAAIGTVMSRLYYGRRKMHTLLKEAGI